MKLSYAYQAANLIASALLLVAVVGHLDSGRYLQWILFQTLAGVLVQLEQSLSAIATRHISRERASDDSARLAAAVAATRTAYRRFALLGVGTMFAAGTGYLAWAGNARFSPTWPLEWAIFCAGYLIWYSCTYAACLLIALERAATFSGVALASRVLNAALSLTLLFAGFGILGLSTSALLTFAAGGVAFLLAARRAHPPRAAEFREPGITYPGLRLRHVVGHAGYMLMAYLIYRSGLILTAGLAHDSGAQASVGLALQILTLLVAVSTVPLQMRVTPLVAAVARGDGGAARRELVVLAAYVNLVFWAGMLGLIAFAHPLLALLPSKGAVLPGDLDLLLLGLAYGIELNLLVLINALLAARRFRFVFVYGVSVAVAIGLALVGWLAGLDFYIAFVLLPAIVQASVATPMIVRLLVGAIGFSPREHATGVIRHLARIVRHPIAIGLAFR